MLALINTILRVLKNNSQGLSNAFFFFLESFFILGYQVLLLKF